MGMYGHNYIILGTKIPRSTYQDRFGYPYRMQEKDNDLVAIGGAGKQWEYVVVGWVIEHINGQGGVKARKPTDLGELREIWSVSASKALAEVGIRTHPQAISIFLVGALE